MKYSIKICLLPFQSFYFRSLSNFRVVFLTGSPSFSPPRWSSVLLHVHYTTVHIAITVTIHIHIRYLLLKYRNLLLYARKESIHQRLQATTQIFRSALMLFFCRVGPWTRSTLLSTHLFAPLPMMKWPSSSSQSNKVTPIPKMPVELICFPPKNTSLAPNQESFFKLQHFCSSRSETT